MNSKTQTNPSNRRSQAKQQDRQNLTTTTKTATNSIQLTPEQELNLDLISQLLTDKLCATRIDLAAISHLVKLCSKCLEQLDEARICIGLKHRLCISLATCYFLLLELQVEDFCEILSCLRMCLTCMSILKQSSFASHILCRALLERSVSNGHLFSTTNECHEWNIDNSIKLSKENHKADLGHRFRRLPNHLTNFSKEPKIVENAGTKSSDSDVPDKPSINTYLIVEAFKSSINNIEAFASLFVEFNCPVVFDKDSWPNDDVLRVINEKNLSILRQFERIPPLWDLYELIGQAGCLRSCLVLVKALLAAHLALWASATSTNSSEDKMISTSRLIPPLAQSKLIPKAFAYTVDVFPHLKSGEVFSVLCDIWHYIKDTNTGDCSADSIPEEERRAKAKAYLNRLRVFMCHHIPGPLYVKIFKEFCSKST